MTIHKILIGAIICAAIVASLVFGFKAAPVQANEPFAAVAPTSVTYGAQAHEVPASELHYVGR
jgi:hypothetical protein